MHTIFLFFSNFFYLTKITVFKFRIAKEKSLQNLHHTAKIDAEKIHTEELHTLNPIKVSSNNGL